jgi:O-antigen/teichoic acid export membrane protein
MGIIIKQSIKGSIWSYAGVVIGFVTTSYLYPNYLSPEIVGLFGLLLAWSTLFAQFSGLGFHGVIARLFPYFRSKEKRHNGFQFIAFMVMIIGFIIFLGIFWLLKPWLVESNIEKSRMFTDYVNLIIPLTFFTMLFSFLDYFNKLLYNAVLGIFLTEFMQRFFVFVVVLLYAFGWFSIRQLVFAYAGVVSLKSVVIFFYLLVKGELNLRPQLHFINKKLRKEMISVAMYSLLTGMGGNIVFNLDKIIVNQKLGLDVTGVYTIAFFFGTLVIIPSRPLLKISGTLIADAWKRNDTDYIADIYRKSCINQFIIAAFLFGGIWVNINNILIILGPEYASGKWVIFFIGLGYLIDMATGANGQIIGYFLIPVWGITGAAIAIATSFFLNNLMRFIYLYSKYKMQPFTYRFLFVVVAFLIAYLVGYIIPQQDLVWDILLRSSLFVVVYIAIIIGSRVSDDINTMKKAFLKKFGY